MLWLITCYFPPIRFLLQWLQSLDSTYFVFLWLRLSLSLAKVVLVGWTDIVSHSFVKLTANGLFGS